MRARNMQALTDAVLHRWPGATVYGVGDAAHALRSSDHNEDDTPGSKAAQSDADGVPEHRAIDIMVRGPFAKADADTLVHDLVTDPRSRARLSYVIWGGHIWSRSSGWARKVYTGSDRHADHVHISGLASDDENSAGWPAIDSEGMDAMLGPCKKGDSGTAVLTLQLMLRNCGFDPGAVDGKYGDKVAAALLALTKSMQSGISSGDAFTPAHYLYVHAKLAQVQARKIAGGVQAPLTVDQVADELARRMTD